MGLSIVKTKAVEVNEEIVEMLEELITRAKEGEFCGFAWAASLPNGSFKTAFTTTTDHPHLVAAIATLQHRMIDMHIGSSKEE